MSRQIYCPLCGGSIDWYCHVISELQFSDTTLVYDVYKCKACPEVELRINEAGWDNEQDKKT